MAKTSKEDVGLDRIAKLQDYFNQPGVTRPECPILANHSLTPAHLGFSSTKSRIPFLDIVVKPVSLCECSGISARKNKLHPIIKPCLKCSAFANYLGLHKTMVPDGKKKITNHTQYLWINPQNVLKFRMSKEKKKDGTVLINFPTPYAAEGCSFSLAKEAQVGTTVIVHHRASVHTGDHGLIRCSGCTVSVKVVSDENLEDAVTSINDLPSCVSMRNLMKEREAARKKRCL